MSTVLQFPNQTSSTKGAQLEDGYTRIANELMDAAMKAPFTSREARVFRAVERATFGWNKKKAWLAASVLSEMTGLTAQNASKALNSLIKKRVIIREGSSRSPSYINTRTSEWDFSSAESRVSPKRNAKPEQVKSAQNGLTELAQNELANKDIKDKTPTNANALVAHAPESVIVDQQPAEQKTAPKKPAAKTKPADPAFEQAWSAYPKREGSNPKNKALECWRARLAEGVSPEGMLAGVQRYAAFVTAKGDLGTGFVMQAKRFFGTGREFENDWTIAAPRAPQRADGRIGYVDSGFDQMNYGETEIPDWARD